jgi:methionine-rich copper-binding protein CopC
MCPPGDEAIYPDAPDNGLAGTRSDRIFTGPTSMSADHSSQAILMTRSHTLRRGALALALVASATAFASPTRRAVVRRHVHLEKSAPAANDTLATTPTSIRFWFSEPVELAVTTAKLASASGAAIALGAATRDAAKDAPVVAPITKPLPAGSYVVTWSTAASDGHPAKGTFTFVVKAKS